MKLSPGHPIVSPIFLIVASILDVNTATQNSRVGVTGIGSDSGFCSKRRERNQVEAKSDGRLKWINDARI